MVQLCKQNGTRDINLLSGKNDATVMWNILEENYYTHSTLWIFLKSSCNYVLVSRALINFITEVIPQTAMLRNSSEDRSSTEAEYVMQLLEASSVHRGFQTLSTSCSYLTLSTLCSCSKLAQFTGGFKPWVRHAVTRS